MQHCFELSGKAHFFRNLFQNTSKNGKHICSQFLPVAHRDQNDGKDLDYKGSYLQKKRKFKVSSYSKKTYQKRKRQKRYNIEAMHFFFLYFWANCVPSHFAPE